MQPIIEIPANLYTVACGITQALDTDSGGWNSWGPAILIGIEGDSFIPDSYKTSGTFDRSEELIKELFSDHIKLHNFVSSEYASRFTDQVSPTIEDYFSFCEQVTITFTSNME